MEWKEGGLAKFIRTCTIFLQSDPTATIFFVFEGGILGKPEISTHGGYSEA